MENDIGNMAKYTHSIAMITVSTRDTLSQRNKGTSVRNQWHSCVFDYHERIVIFHFKDISLPDLLKRICFSFSKHYFLYCHLLIMLQNFWNYLRTKNVRFLVHVKRARHIINRVHQWQGHASRGLKYNVKGDLPWFFFVVAFEIRCISMTNGKYLDLPEWVVTFLVCKGLERK